MDEADREYIKELKNQPYLSGYEVPDIDGQPCRIKILGRGEMAFFQVGDRGLLMEVIAGEGAILKKSIKEWDSGARVTPTEREKIVERMIAVMNQLGWDEVKVV